MQILRKITPVYRTEKTIQVNPLPPLFQEFNLRTLIPTNTLDRLGSYNPKPHVFHHHHAPQLVP